MFNVSDDVNVDLIDIPAGAAGMGRGILHAGGRGWRLFAGGLRRPRGYGFFPRAVRENRGRGPARRDRPEFFQVAADIRLVAVFRIRNERFERIGRGKERADNFRIRNQLAASDLSQNVFHLVGQFLDHLQAHEPGAAFYRVRRPIDLVYQLQVDIGAVLLDCQQIAFNVREMFKGFVDKTFKNIVFHGLFPSRRLFR